MYLTGEEHIYTASVARRMSWASKRSTTRPEDRTYSLLGIFGVQMPLIYGEGENAFRRLQLEIMRVIDDHSILAWDVHQARSEVQSSITFDFLSYNVPTFATVFERRAAYFADNPTEVLAPDVSRFAESGSFGPAGSSNTTELIPTQRGVQIKAHISYFCGPPYAAIILLSSMVILKRWDLSGGDIRWLYSEDLEQITLRCHEHQRIDKSVSIFLRRRGQVWYRVSALCDRAKFETPWAKLSSHMTTFETSVEAEIRAGHIRPSDYLREQAGTNLSARTAIIYPGILLAWQFGLVVHSPHYLLLLPFFWPFFLMNVLATMFALPESHRFKTAVVVVFTCLVLVISYLGRSR